MRVKVQKSYIIAISVIGLITGLGYLVSAVEALSVNPAKIIISEVKIDGSGSAEYVRIYNQSDAAIDLTHYKLEYAKPAFSTINCLNPNWASSANGFETVLPSTLLNPGEAVNISRTMTDSLGGSLRIIDDQMLVHDLVGWDNGSSQAPCLDDQILRAPAPWADDGESIQRLLECETNIPIDTNNNAHDFILSSTPGSFLTNCPAEEPDEENEGGQGAPNSSCTGIIISELLSNPAGSDGGHEFIELYNPTNHVIELKGCKLQTSANSKLFSFSALQLAPGKFLNLSDKTTGLTLANSAGGNVWLVDTDNSEIYQVDYPAELEDNVAWALFDGGFSETFAPTPGEQNELVSTKPCPNGQFRNPDTQRCNNILTASGLRPCAPGKVRNPETNRCRSIASLASVLKPCAANQFRNPETNRCKKTGSSSALKPCAKGQQRNPETNRCRKVAGVLSDSTQNPVQDVEAAAGKTQGLWLAAGSVIGALLYGLWEWRNEAILGFMSLKKKFLG